MILLTRMMCIWHLLLNSQKEVLMLLDVKNINFLKFLVVKVQEYFMFEYSREVINVITDYSYDWLPL